MFHEVGQNIAQQLLAIRILEQRWNGAQTELFRAQAFNTETQVIKELDVLLDQVCLAAGNIEEIYWNFAFARSDGEKDGWPLSRVFPHTNASASSSTLLQPKR